MERVLLIDDEIHVRSLLKYLIHWEELGMKLAAEFDSAAEALVYVKANPVDIVVSDIKMPEMDGLEMIEEMQAIRSGLSFILVSGYQDFKYAQKALRLGVTDYVVKPINEEEINRVLRQTVEKKQGIKQGDQQTRAARRKFIEFIQNGKENPDLTEIARKYHLNFQSSGGYRILQLGFCNVSAEDPIEDEAERIGEALLLSIRLPCLEAELFPLSRLRYDILIQYEREKEVEVLRILDTCYREQIRKYRGNVSYHCYLSVGKQVLSLKDLKASSDSAHFFLSGRLGYRENRVYIADILPQSEKLMAEKYPVSRESVREFQRYIEAVDEKGIRRIIHRLYKELEDREEQNYIFYFFLAEELYHHMSTVLNRLEVHPSELSRMRSELEFQMDNCDTVPMLVSMLERFCIDNVNQLIGGKQDNTQVYVNFAKQYIEEHYAEEVTLQAIADQAHVNAAYLSSVFKKNTGINYQAYLTAVRIEKAKEYLQKLDKNLSQIANEVGYTSTRYFSKTFEHEVGMKPSEYRRVYLREQR